MINKKKKTQMQNQQHFLTKSKTKKFIIKNYYFNNSLNKNNHTIFTKNTYNITVIRAFIELF